MDLRPIGGQTRVVLSTELSFPIPGSGQDRTFRSFLFFDAGNVYPVGTFDFTDLRYSTGVGISWISPFGPLKIGLGFPLRTRPGDVATSTHEPLLALKLLFLHRRARLHSAIQSINPLIQVSDFAGERATDLRFSTAILKVRTPSGSET